MQTLAGLDEFDFAALLEVTLEKTGEAKPTIDGLAPGGTPYLIQVSHPQFGAVTRSVELRDQSVYLGEIRLGGSATNPFSET